MRHSFLLILIGFILLLPACIAQRKQELLLLKHDITDITNWKKWDFSESFSAFKRSCAKLLELPDGMAMGKTKTIAKDWKPACKEAMEKKNDRNARVFFEKYFVPYQASTSGDINGLFTGYYEIDLKGSRKYHDKYLYPIYKTPEKTQTSLGRRRIENGELQNKNLELFYVDDPVRLFFLQIQGSGRVMMEDGSTVRVGYAGKNQCPYRALGKYLIDSGDIPKEVMSAAKIREWLYRNPYRARAIMMYNPSYVFFRELKGEGPIGGQGVALTPEISLAVDDEYIPYGAPIWLETELPVEKGNGLQPFHRLMIAQDTGGAIRGPVRGDIFFGYGKRAEFLADHMKQQGMYYILLPKTAHDREK